MDHQRSLVSFLAGALLVGCAQTNESGLSAAQQQTANDLRSMATASKGDWNKLTSAQQQELIKSVGSESSAKTVLQMKANPPKPVAPGPPAGWKPGGPPPGH
jgi:hypothetical protein